MEFIKAHKGFIIILAIFILLGIISFLILEKFIIFHGSVYGNRLKNIKKNEVSKKVLKQIEDEFAEKNNIKSSKVYITGRIINIINNVEGESSLENLQSYTEIVFNDIKEKQRKLYDIQIIYKNDKDEDKFPIIGYLGKGLTEFCWSYRG